MFAVSTANATYQGSMARAYDLEQYEVSQATGGSYNPSADDAAAGATYTLAIANANATNAIALCQDQANATTAAAQSTAAWTQAQDDATLAVTVTESQSYAGQQMNLASLATSTYTQMGDSYATAMGTFATDYPTPWATQEGGQRRRYGNVQRSCAHRLACQSKEHSRGQQPGRDQRGQGRCGIADQTAASARAACAPAAAQQLADPHHAVGALPGLRQTPQAVPRPRRSAQP